MKNSTMIIVLVMIGAIFAAGMYTQKAYPIFSTLAISSACGDVSQEYLNGAQQGDCFVDIQNNQQVLYLVESLTQKGRNGPHGYEQMCTVGLSGDLDKIMGCGTAFNTDGTRTKLCRTDSDCNNMKCVNRLCQKELRTCTQGQIHCTSDKYYERCLTNGRFSGILECADNAVCIDNKGCVVKSTGEPSTQPYQCSKGQVYNPTTQKCETDSGDDSDNGDGSNTPFNIPVSYLWIGGGVIAAVVLLSLLKK